MDQGMRCYSQSTIMQPSDKVCKNRGPIGKFPEKLLPLLPWERAEKNVK